MRKISYLLILFSFLVCTPCLANEIQQKLSELKNQSKQYEQKSKDLLDRWETHYFIQENFYKLTTIPLFQNASIQFYLGPGQFRIVIPLF